MTGRPILLVVALATVPAGCTYTVTYDRLGDAPRHEILFLVADREIESRRFDSTTYRRVHVSKTTIVAPVVSRDGSRLAYLDTGTATRPFSSRNVSLVVLSLDGANRSAWREATIPLHAFDEHPLRLLDVIPPIWDAGDGALIVTHATGIDRIALDGAHTPVVEARDVSAAALSSRGHLAYADAKTFAIIDRDGRPVASIPSEIRDKLYYRVVRSMSFSADGRRLAFSQGPDLYVFDLSSETLAHAHRAGNDIYWARWLPGETRFAILSGKARRRSVSRGVSDWSSTTEGKYRLYTVPASGGERHTLWKENLIDVREARPSLSPDGRYVAVVGNAGPHTIFVVDTSDPGVEPLGRGRTSRFPVWLP